MTAEPHQAPGEPTVRRFTIHGPEGSKGYQLRENSNDAILIEVDGTPLVGFDHTGAGWWPYPDETWIRSIVIAGLGQAEAPGPAPDSVALPGENRCLTTA